MILRLTQRYFGSGQIVIANKQCICFSEDIGTHRARGLYFMGIVYNCLKVLSKRVFKQLVSKGKEHAAAI